jgi:hypothetical protein
LVWLSWGGGPFRSGVLKERAIRVDVRVMTTLCVGSPLALLPPRRLGALLQQTRTNAGWTPADVVAAIRGRLNVHELAAVEAGEQFADDNLVRLLAALYGVALEAIVPQRAKLVIDPDEGVLQIGARRVLLAPTATPREVLMRYLALVYTMRGIKPGRFLVPRVADLEVLGTYLDRTPDGLRRDLEDLMASAREELTGTSSTLRARAVLPGVGLLVGLSAVGALLLIGGGDDALPAAGRTVPVTSVAPRGASATTVIGDAVTFDHGPGTVAIGDGLAFSRGPATSAVIADAVTFQRETVLPGGPGQPDRRIVLIVP